MFDIWYIFYCGRILFFKINASNVLFNSPFLLLLIIIIKANQFYSKSVELIYDSSWQFLLIFYSICIGGTKWNFT